MHCCTRARGTSADQKNLYRQWIFATAVTWSLEIWLYTLKDLNIKCRFWRMFPHSIFACKKTSYRFFNCAIIALSHPAHFPDFLQFPPQGYQNLQGIYFLTIYGSTKKHSWSAYKDCLPSLGLKVNWCNSFNGFKFLSALFFFPFLFCRNHML